MATAWQNKQIDYAMRSVKTQNSAPVGGFESKNQIFVTGKHKLD